VSVAVHHSTCPRCGADGEGSAWCPRCGLNLRVKGSAEAAGEDRVTQDTQPLPHDATPPAPERRGRLPAVAGLAAVLLVAVVVLGVVLLTRGGSGASGNASHGPTPTPAAPTATANPTASPAPALAVTRARMEQVLVRYEDAYSNEDANGLAALFAADLVRRNGTDPPEGRAAALATYQDQFDHLTNPDYRLSGMSFTEGAADGVAAGSYTISSDGGTVAGQIGFHLVLQDGRLLIDRIVIRPN
jgi:ketosteroid isomerase-like protein